MASYKKLIAQFKKLMRQAAALKAKIAAALAEIKAKMAANGIPLAVLDGNPYPMAACRRYQGLIKITTYRIAVPPAPTLTSTPKCTHPPFTLRLTKGEPVKAQTRQNTRVRPDPVEAQSDHPMNPHPLALGQSKGPTPSCAA